MNNQTANTKNHNETSPKFKSSPANKVGVDKDSSGSSHALFSFRKKNNQLSSRERNQSPRASSKQI